MARLQLMKMLNYIEFLLLLAAVAAGEYNSIYDAMDKMHCLSEGMVYPDAARGRAYDRLYEEYLTLHDVFGRGVNPVMMKLRKIARKEKQ